MKSNVRTLLIALLIFFTHRSFSQNCDSPMAQVDLASNNVRARLNQGGSLWWDGSDGRYIFPANSNPTNEVSALFAGGFWMAGFDDGGNLKMAASTYGLGSGAGAYWAGPLNMNGDTDASTCANWDRFFKVNQLDINAHRADWQDNGVIDNTIPVSILGWPGKGNPHFIGIHGFELPDASLAPFFDNDGNGQYNPYQGDYPMTREADEAIWWIFNYSSSLELAGSLPLNVEVRVMAYAYASDNDAINNTTFYDVQIVNRAITSLDSTYFSLWVDPDLGCYTDDFVGCIPEEKMAIIYNEDAVDGSIGCNCDQGISTYCENIPMMAIKLIKGFSDQNGDDLGLSSFIIYGYGLPPNQSVPNNASEYYNLMTAHWLDGSSMLDPQGNPTNFQYPGSPADENAWSMCSANLPQGDHRMLMNFGPFRLNPGESNSMTFAVIGVEDVEYPCPATDQISGAASEVCDFYNILNKQNEIYLPENAVTFSPNPMTDQSVLSLKSSKLTINELALYTSEGRLLLHQQNLHTKSYNIEGTSLPSGIYLYKVICEDGRIAVGKFVVQ